MYDRKTEIVMELAKDSYGGMVFSDIVNKYNLIIHNRIIDEHKEREHIVSGYYKPLVSKDCDIKDINSIETAIKSIKDEEKLRQFYSMIYYVQDQLESAFMGRNKFIQFLTKMEINQMNFNKRKITFDEFKRIFANDIAFYSRRIESKVIIELAELANESVVHKELSNMLLIKLESIGLKWLRNLVK